MTVAEAVQEATKKIDELGAEMSKHDWLAFLEEVQDHCRAHADGATEELEDQSEDDE